MARRQEGRCPRVVAQQPEFAATDRIQTAKYAGVQHLSKGEFRGIEVALTAVGCVKLAWRRSLAAFQWVADKGAVLAAQA